MLKEGEIIPVDGYDVVLILILMEHAQRVYDEIVYAQNRIVS